MQIKITAFPRTIVRFLIMGVIFFTIVGVGIQIGKYVFNFQDEWLNLLFNVDLEMNLPTWYSALMIAFCAILCKIIATGKKQQGDRYTKDWQLLSLIFWFLAIDEIVSIHEIFIIPEVSQALHLPKFLYSAWVIPGTIFVVWFVRRYSKFIYHFPPKSRLHFILAACIYVGGALVMEMVGSYIAQSLTQQNIIYALSTSVEECLEMSGVVMLIYALIYYLGQWVHQLDLQIEILESVSKPEQHRI
ncbi:hypothetical protein C7B62_07695 [Pleurocapsa sp. CCALA 161]|uniref:hypothetical protein n=1 Tax=Pleurocapsa sp. CCALA 161 TaxID=2107688 RepID=UPI000D062482|nr:hypothetical protein [Pleurocapsa sp. CCALA 161]PSB10903.1 hypothetical protein C7B62_07695 [Pleurocapsa sp. CCALA 161]